MLNSCLDESATVSWEVDMGMRSIFDDLSKSFEYAARNAYLYERSGVLVMDADAEKMPHIRPEHYQQKFTNNLTFVTSKARLKSQYSFRQRFKNIF